MHENTHRTKVKKQQQKGMLLTAMQNTIIAMPRELAQCTTQYCARSQK